MMAADPSIPPDPSCVLGRGRGVGDFIGELFRFNLYQRSQGRIARQATFAALAVIVGLGAWVLYESRLPEAWDGYVRGQYTDQQVPVWGTVMWLVLALLPLAVLLGGLWASFRIVQMPTFADFLISVESEMRKVSWPSRAELARASIVVMLVIFVLAGVLYAFDIMWEILLKWIFR